ncbi:MAG: hypothetical protein J2P28_24560, partial [Actinobacteria bacterium]|nr:hypothetical protein [Actinomycetota bacterium]
MERLRWSGVFLLLLAGLLIEAPPAAADGNTADLYAIVSGPSQVVIGDKVGTGFIDIFNRGPDVATGILFTAKLTGPGQYDAALSPSACHVDGPSATCKLDNLPLGGVANLLDLTVDTTGLGTIV